jgi:hypothetical protein
MLWPSVNKKTQSLFCIHSELKELLHVCILIHNMIPSFCSCSLNIFKEGYLSTCVIRSWKRVW